MRGLVGRNPGVTVVMEFGPARYEDPRAFLREIRREGFPLRRVGYEAEVSDITEADALGGAGGADLMLFRRRD
jgi:hypothetical protein